MFSIYYTNHGYGPAERFDSQDAALSYGKSKCFEFVIIKDYEFKKSEGEIVASWSPIGGYRTH